VGFAWPPRHRDAGALLPHLFTLAGTGLTCGPALRRFVSVALSRGFPRVGFPTTLALRCPDFPRGAGCLSDPPAAAWPAKASLGPGGVPDHPRTRPPDLERTVNRLYPA